MTVARASKEVRKKKCDFEEELSWNSNPSGHDSVIKAIRSTILVVTNRLLVGVDQFHVYEVSVETNASIGGQNNVFIPSERLLSWQVIEL